MAHPHNAHRQHKVEKSRAHHLLKGYAKGGTVKAEKIGKRALSLHKEEHSALHADGGKSKHRMDRPHRAKGGKVKGKNSARTIVNVITGGHPAGGAVPPAPPMAPPGPPSMGVAPAGPPPMAKPPMPPPGAGGPPGGMPMRARGGPVKAIGMHVGTHVEHDKGKNDGKDIGRGKVVTFKSGGVVKSFRAYGGKVEAPKGVAKDTKLPGGSGGGEARLVKAKRAAREYHGPD